MQQTSERRKEGGDSTHEHVLGEPAFITSENGSNAEGKALLSEEGVASIARTEGHDLAGLGEVDDVAVLDVAGPGNVPLSLSQGSTD